MGSGYPTGQDLTSFSKSGERPDPKIIAHRSKATRGEMLVNPDNYERFCHKAHINIKVRPCACPPVLCGPFCHQVHINIRVRGSACPLDNSGARR